MNATTITFMHAGKPYQIEQFNPPRTPNGGAVIIAHGSDGLVDNSNGPWLTMMNGYAKSLAARGFVTLMPDYFGGTGLVKPDELSTYEAIIADTIAYAKTLPGINANRIGVLGFSLGGYLCLRNRASVKVLVEFFAPAIILGLGDIGMANSTQLQVQIHHGKKDTLLPLKENADPIEQRLLSEGATVIKLSYPEAGHGFSGKDAGDADAQKKSKRSTLAFFKKYL